tara:strand:+ start:109027 stop:109242 length:216 start_codon:yes stop_codon:yes gene_type:complete
MVKVISLSEEAYGTLKGIKEEKESFSQVVLRLAKKKENIMSVFGCASEDKEFISGLKKAYKDRDKNELRVY